jgi:hypothetical protein
MSITSKKKKKLDKINMKENLGLLGKAKNENNRNKNYQTFGGLI